MLKTFESEDWRGYSSKYSLKDLLIKCIKKQRLIKKYELTTDKMLNDIHLMKKIKPITEVTLLALLAVQYSVIYN